MNELAQYIPVSKAKNRLLALIRELEQSQEAVALTRDGVPAAVLLSMEQFQGLIETIEVLADAKAMRSLRRSLKQAERGEWLSYGEVFDEDAS
jgi:antitoxin YefM